VTAQLQEANDVLNSLVPANSANVRKTSYSIAGLYAKFSSTKLKSSLPHLNEEYFRQLVHELHIICNVESQACPLCDLWDSTDCGETLDTDVYARCHAHFRTKELQMKAYYNFMSELGSDSFGKHALGKILSGALIVFDFGQLNPSSKRHKDGAMHFWLKRKDIEVRSVPFHYVGDDAKYQPASVAFAVSCIRHCVNVEELKHLELLVFFSDGGSKEFNSDLVAMLPVLESELNKRIIWNYWASNHGAGVSDTDQQNARSSLKTELPERKVINDTAQIVDIIAKKQPGANVFDASSFPRSITSAHLPNTTGISEFHCFLVDKGNIIGYHDSWLYINGRNFSVSSKILSNSQLFLKARHDAGLNVFYCELCDWYYVESHPCKANTSITDQIVLVEKKEECKEVEHKESKHSKKKHEKKGKKRKSRDEMVNRLVQVWYSDEERKLFRYFKGKVIKDKGNDRYTVEWKDKRRKIEKVKLTHEHMTESETDEDRWHFITEEEYDRSGT